MSRTNPEKAVAAILPLPVRTPSGACVAPMTLGMYAALERIKSPLITGEAPKDTLDLIPSLYLLTHDPREVFAGNVLDLAMAWANEQPVSALAEIREAAERQMSALLDVCPETEKKKTSQKATDGSRRGRDTPQKSSDGATMKSCGKRRRVPSRCC